MIYLTTAHTVHINLYSCSSSTFMFSVVLPTRKNYGCHIRQSTAMGQQDKISNILILKTMQMGKKCNMKSFWKHKQHRTITVKNSYFTRQMLLVGEKSKPIFITVKSLRKGKAQTKRLPVMRTGRSFSSLTQHSLEINVVTPHSTLLFIHKALQFPSALAPVHSSSSWETWSSRMKQSPLTANHQKEPPQPECFQAPGHASEEKSRAGN